jgi:hypothetical protein
MGDYFLKGFALKPGETSTAFWQPGRKSLERA